MFAKKGTKSTNGQLFEDITNRDINKNMNISTQEEIMNDGLDREGLAFSKSMVVASLLIYFAIVFIVLYMAIDIVNRISLGMIENAGSLSGLSALSAAIGAIATGSTILPVTICVNYYKKTQVGHTAKVEASLYKTILGLQLGYNKSMMKYQSDLKLTDSEVNKIENQSKAKIMSDGIFNDASAAVKNSMNDATALAKKETGA